MKDRCLQPNNASYGHYGAIGVTVCTRWLKFENFLEDMGERPGKKFVLSRHQDKGNYEPGNVVWKLWEQNNSERDVAKGERQHLAKIKEHQVPDIRRMHSEGVSNTEIAAIYKVYRTTIERIIKRKTWKHVP
jgi:hypothetical protein